MFFCFSFIGNLFHKTLHSSIVSANFPKFFCWMVLYSSAHFCNTTTSNKARIFFKVLISLSQKSSFCDCRVEGYFGFDCPSSVSISFFSIKGGSLTTSKQRFKKSLARSSKGKRLLNLCCSHILLWWNHKKCSVLICQFVFLYGSIFDSNAHDVRFPSQDIIKAWGVIFIIRFFNGTIPGS